MPNIAPDPPLHVAVGIVMDRDRVFVARRPAPKHQGGKWEFPGGKVDRGEEVLTALRRELHEELGIEVHAARPFMRRRHVYPEKTVLLDVWKVTAFGGTPRSRERQEMRWARTDELFSLDFSDADRFVLRRLWLPSLYLITDSRRVGNPAFLERLETALRAGARLIQLREPHMSESEYRAYAGKVIPFCHRYGAQVLLNTSPEWAVELGADGVHLNSRCLMELTTRPLSPEYWVAASCHNAEELERARRIQADFSALSPVMATASHPGAQTLGWAGFEKLCRDADLPVYALGGMKAADLPRAREAGAQGLAMVGAVWGARDVSEAVSSVKRDY
jgi:8-oxo-dGTP diphosphatase